MLILEEEQAGTERTFTLGSDTQGKRVRIDFDGVYMNATVWVNGHEVGTHPYGLHFIFL